MIVTVASGGPDWVSVMTAFGTVAAAVAAVSIALWSDRRSRALIGEERRLTLEREQFAEAYAAQVALGERDAGPVDDVYEEPVDESVKRLAVMVVNRGSFTITGIEARFSYDGKSLASHARYRRLSGFGQVRLRLRKDWSPSSERAMYGILTPLDAGFVLRAMRSTCSISRTRIRWCGGRIGGARGGSTGSVRCGRSATARTGRRSRVLIRAGSAPYEARGVLMASRPVSRASRSPIAGGQPVLCAWALHSTGHPTNHCIVTRESGRAAGPR